MIGKQGKGMEEEKSDHFHSVVREDLSEEMTFTVRKSGAGCFASAFYCTECFNSHSVLTSQPWEEVIILHYR